MKIILFHCVFVLAATVVMAAPASFGLCDILTEFPHDMQRGDTLELVVMSGNQTITLTHVTLVVDSFSFDPRNGIPVAPKWVVPPYRSQSLSVCLERVYGELLPPRASAMAGAPSAMRVPDGRTRRSVANRWR